MAGISDEDGPSRHSSAEHLYGAMAGHQHGPGDFDHDHDEDFLPLDSKVLESVPLISMGLDVGSSGTQVIFTRLEMRGPGEHRALRRQAKSRQTLYMSPIALTPFRADNTIDEDRLWQIVDQSFNNAGLTPDDIETGIVILTGAAAERANAQAIAHRVAEEVGELVCAAAGDHMEAMLAAHGSGAVAASRQGTGRRILNIDVGGATTKFAIAADGHVVDSAAMRVGGRLMAIDRNNVIVRLDAPGEVYARRRGLEWAIGVKAATADMSDVAQDMAQAVFDALSCRPLPAEVRDLFITAPIDDFGQIDGIMISGGVAEYVYGRENRDFGDLGWRLGRALRRRFDEGACAWPLAPPGECIRATALGASEHSVQISGQTIYISDHAALLPRRNLQVIQPEFDFGDHIDPDILGAAIRAHRDAFDLGAADRDFALAFRWRGTLDYPRLRAFGEGILLGMRDVIAAGFRLYLMLEGDAAMSLGAILREDLCLANHVLVIDGIVLRDFDFVDIGRMRLPSHTTPVTIKSLIFGPERR